MKTKTTKKHWWELRVEPIAGEPLRFRVESASNPEEVHTVDLELNDGGGFCDCMDFCARRDGFLKATRLPYQDRTACSHVKAAFRVFGMWAIKKVSLRHQQERIAHYTSRTPDTHNP